MRRYYDKPSPSGFTFDVHTVPLNSDGPDISKLNQYKLVIWFTGRQFTNTLTSVDQLNLQTYLDNARTSFYHRPGYRI